MRGQGRLFKRGDIFWMAYYLNGREYRESTKCTDEKKAEKVLSDRLDERGAARKGARTFVTPKAKRITVRQLCEALRRKYELNEKATPQNLSHLNRAEKDFGHYRALELTADEIDDYIDRRKQDGDAKATVNRVTGMLLQAYRHGVVQKHFSEFNIPSITHLDEKGNERKGFLKPEQFEKLLKHIPNDGLRDFVEWGYKTGQRKNETAAMTWAMFDSKDGVLRIPGDQCKNRIDRTSPLTAALRAIIERRQAKREIKTKDGSVRMTEFIFHRGDGRRIGDFKKSWKTACTKAEVTATLYHDLRRSFVKNGRDAGIPAALLMRAGGWESEAMLKRYSIDLNEEVRAAMEQADKYVATAQANAAQESNLLAMRK